MEVLSSYKNGNYNVTIYSDGTKIRENDLDFFDPDRPESIDLTVTYQCEIGCPYCYQGCTKDGETCNFKDPIIETFPEGMEVAIGASGGVFTKENVNNFTRFLKKLKSKKCIPSITVNQTHFIAHRNIIEDLIKNKLVYGVGVSISNKLKGFYGLSYVLQYFKEQNIHKNIVLHTIAGVHTVENLKRLSHIFEDSYKPKILVLGYKNIGKGIDYGKQFPDEVRHNIEDLKNNIIDISSLYSVMSFDNPACVQLNLKDKVSPEEWESHYLGDDGSHTFYLDLVKRTFSISSLHTETYDIDDFKSIKDMFLFVKEKSKNN